MQKKLWLTFILALMLVLTSCVNPNAPAAPAAQPAEKPAAEQPAEEEAAEEPAAEEAAEEPAAATVSEFHAAWPFTAPPAGHFNTFAPSDSFQLGIYQNLMEPS